jgi:2-iminobutanoate/2-iminopropanoate deaminase
LISDMIHSGVDSLPALGPYRPVVNAGGLIFVSAQTGIDPLTLELPGGDFKTECRQAFANLLTAVRAGGATAADIVKMTVLYTDLADFDAVNAVFAETFPHNPPARTAAVVQLPGGKRVAVDAIAVAPQS